MKKTILAMLILLIIISIGIFEQLYLNYVFKEIEENLMLFDNNIDNKEECSKIINDAIACWEKHRHILECFITHNEIKDIVLLLAEIKGFVDANMMDDAKASNIKLIDTSKHTAHLLKYRLEHIF